MVSPPHRRLNAVRQALLPIAALAVILSCVSTREELGPLGEWALTEQALIATSEAQFDLTQSAIASLEAELHAAQTAEAGVRGTEGMARGTIGWPSYPERTPSTLDSSTIRDAGAWHRPDARPHASCSDHRDGTWRAARPSRYIARY